ncbi:MAG: protein translocase subunit SecD [Acidobacteriota bacterium]|nr:MAG: protein translocase subunit SecD [Acidobacteriota bacterium]
MKKKFKYRLLIIALVLTVSVAMLYYQRINLGLDLQGGIHLVLQVEIEGALESEVEQARDRVETDLGEREIKFSEVRIADGRVEVLGVPADSEDAIEDYFDEYAPAWNYRSRTSEGLSEYSFSMTEAFRKTLAMQSVRQARDIVERRIDQYGVAEPTIVIYGSGDVQDQIIVELPGVEDFERVKDLIKSTAQLELKVVHPTIRGPFPSRESAIQAFNNVLPDDYEILPLRDRSVTGEAQFIPVRKAASITGQHLKNARRSQDPYTGKSEVVFFLNSEGVSLFSDTTAANVGNQLAIVLDDIVRSAPNINQHIDSESARITGSFTPEEAEDLALVLRSGALPAKLRILEERSVGPSLGRDSIVRGVYASGLGLLLVVVGMFIVYRLSGINAIACLTLNLLILMGVLAYFRATLTLPGIAGVILTIGMAVDANILIFERIKEELRLGKTVRAAVDAGFDRVFSTILDTNITTLVAALFLFQFGTGPVRGFAVTLAVGLLANIFTATFVSRTFFATFLQSREVPRLSI